LRTYQQTIELID